MKRSLRFLFVALFLFGCQTHEQLLPEDQKCRTIFAEIQNDNGLETYSRVYISKDGDVFHHYWQSADAIKVFNSAGENEDCTLTSGENTSSGAFSCSLGGTIIGAIYPADTDGATYADHLFSVTFPVTQTYTANSYDPSANIYIATGNATDNLNFKSVTAYLRFGLYTSSAATVSKIVVSSRDGAKISGLATVSEAGVVSVSDGGTTSITLNCSELSLSTDSEIPSIFYIALPAVTISGLEIRIYNGSGESETYQFRNITTSLAANNVLDVSPALEFNTITAKTNAILLKGEYFNRAIKKLVTGAEVDSSNVVNSDIYQIVFVSRKNLTGLKVGNYAIVSDSSIPGNPEALATYNTTTKTVTIQTAADSIKAQLYENMFRGLEAMTALVGFEDVRAPGEACSAKRMFHGNKALSSLNLTGITNEITNSYSMFCNCRELVSITGLDDIVFKRGTSSVATCYMFQNCYKLAGTVAPKISYMYNSLSMFENCRALTTIDLSNCFTHSDRASAASMFAGCTALTTVIFPTNTNSFRSATNMSNWFDGDTSLTTLTNFTYVHSKRSSKVKYNKDFSYMFRGCSSLTSVDLSKLATDSAKTMAYMFSGCSRISSLDLSSFNTDSVSNMTYMFNNCSSITKLNLNSFNFSKDTLLSYFARGCSLLDTLYMNHATSTLENCNIKYLLNGCSNMKVWKLGPNITLSGCSMSYTIQNPNTFTAARSDNPFKVYCNPDVVGNLLSKQSNPRDLCNYKGGGDYGSAAATRILFISAATGNELVLSPTYGAVTKDTVATEP